MHIHPFILKMEFEYSYLNVNNKFGIIITKKNRSLDDFWIYVYNWHQYINTLDEVLLIKLVQESQYQMKLNTLFLLF